MRKFVVDRSRWWRGRGGEDSALLRNQDGTMCCLGFLARECGLKEEEIQGVAEFRDLVGGLEYTVVDKGGPPHWGLPMQLVDFNNHTDDIVANVHDRIVNVNDDPAIPESLRESNIIELMRSVGVEPVFVGEGHPQRTIEELDEGVP